MKFQVIAAALAPFLCASLISAATIDSYADEPSTTLYTVSTYIPFFSFFLQIMSQLSFAFYMMK
jgi:hypothetical protein